jgi:Protein of unknown function (DUF1295)
MTAVYLAALVAMVVALSILMARAWIMQQRMGNSGWVDTIWTFAVGLVGAGGALWSMTGGAPNARQWLVAGLVAIWSLRLGLLSRPAAPGLRTIPAMPPSQGSGESIQRDGCSPSHTAYDLAPTKEEVAP